MNRKFYFLLFIVISMLAVSCKTASKMYQKGNYAEAVELAAKKLQKNPDDAKLLTIIQDAYTYAVNDHESRIRTYTRSTNELKWEWVYNEYVSLQSMYNAIYKVPSVFSIVHPTDYADALQTYREKAGDTRFERGLALMEAGDKKSYQQAYREFQTALQFIPGDRAMTQKLEEAYEYAVTNIVVLPMQQDGGFVYSSYRVGTTNFDDQLIRNLQNYSGNQFVKFYSAWDARGKQIRIDNEIELRMNTIDIGRYFDDRKVRKVQKEVVVKETVYKPDSIVKEYAKVSATITSTVRNMHSSASLHVVVRDEDGRRVWSNTFSSVHNWSTTFASFTGDSRALSETDKQTINQRQEFPPSEDAILQCMLDEINNNALYSVRNYFNQY